MNVKSTAKPVLVVHTLSNLLDSMIVLHDGGNNTLSLFLSIHTTVKEKPSNIKQGSNGHKNLQQCMGVVVFLKSKFTKARGQVAVNKDPVFVVVRREGEKERGGYWIELAARGGKENEPNCQPTSRRQSVKQHRTAFKGETQMIDDE